MTFSGPATGAAGAQTPPALRSELLTTLAELERIAPEWEALASACAAPTALPAWQLAWWRRLAPAGALLRAVAIRDGDRLVALAPYAVTRGAARATVWEPLAAAMTHRVEPLAEPGCAAVAMEATVAQLAAADVAPDLVRFEAIAADASPWRELEAAWSQARRLEEFTQTAPYVSIGDEGFDAWLNGKSRNFRQQTRRFRRKLEQAGGVVRMSQPGAGAERDVAALLRLHHARWDDRGGSSLGDGDGVGAMLRDAAPTMVAAGTMRIWIVELDGEPISAQLFLAAGGTVHYWNGGFDPRHAELKPALLGLVAGIEDCFAQGDTLLDLGGGAQDYKLRLADGTRELSSGVLVPRDARPLQSRLALLPRQLRSVTRAGFRRLTPAAQGRVRAALARLSRRR